MQDFEQFNRSICPVCFSLYPAGLAQKDHPTCPDCGSESFDVDVIPLGRYLADTTLERLLKKRDKWAVVSGFRETYKQTKLQRMAHVIDLKREFAARNEVV